MQIVVDTTVITYPDTTGITQPDITGITQLKQIPDSEHAWRHQIASGRARRESERCR